MKRRGRDVVKSETSLGVGWLCGDVPLHSIEGVHHLFSIMGLDVHLERCLKMQERKRTRGLLL